MRSKSGKKFIAALLSAGMILSAAACGNTLVIEKPDKTTPAVSESVTDTPGATVAKDGRRKLIIDTDTGADDASALILAAMDAEVDIVGVTVLVGNVDLEQSTKNALMALETAGCDAPVYKGSADTFAGMEKSAYSVFGNDGMGDAGLIHPTKQATEGDAVDFIINTVKNNPGEIEIVALGPATNVAKAIRKDPQAMKDVKMIWSMGSAGLGPGNATPVAEFNVYADAEAYSILLASGLPLTIVGLDVCGDEAQWTDEQFELLEAGGSTGRFVAASFGKLREFYKSNGSESVMNCDGLAMMCVLYPDFVRDKIKTHAVCMTGAGDAYAQVIFYKEGFTYDVTGDDMTYNTDLITDVDREHYFADYLALINNEDPFGDDKDSEKNGGVYLLYTSDVHCGVDEGFGYAGLKEIRDRLQSEGYETLLVDNGDAIQGEHIGTISKGEAIIELMNELHYDAAIPGNHEFDYGMEQFLSLAGKADFPYISCNFNKEGSLVFDPYIIREAAGIKIAFVGVTTPTTLTSSTPASFQDEKGEFVYGFMQGDDGTAVYEAVQKAVDDARAEGADLVYVMGHVGMDAECRPWTYADIIANTSGIDVFLDGHSHDSDQIVMKDKEGREVTRSAVGTKLSSIGYSRISADGVIEETGIWSWPNKDGISELFSVENDISIKVAEAKEALDKEMERVVASTDVELTISDPQAKDSAGNPVRMIRRAETNLGDLCADAYRDQSGADIAFVNGGGIRVSIDKGEITYGEIISVHPFGNSLCVIEVSGQQILDALEWGARAIPDENGAFIQVSGLSYAVDAAVDSPCVADENGMFKSIRGRRRVSDVMVGDDPIDPKKMYTLAGNEYMLLKQGDGYTMFEGAKLLQDRVKLDNQVLIDYIVDTLKGEVGEEYSDPFGQGRIVIND